MDCPWETRYSEKSPSVPHSQSLIHRFQPKPRRWLALARLRRILFSVQFRICEKHSLKFPMAKYCTQPRKIGLIFSISPAIRRVATVPIVQTFGTGPICRIADR